MEKNIMKKMSYVSIIGNVVLSVCKAIAGIVGHSSAMISDAVHSLSDVFTTVIAYVGVKISKKDADHLHPYGHERFESVASILLAVLLAGTGIMIGYTGIENIIHKNYVNVIPGTIALLAAVLSIVTKEAMFWYTYINAEKINSSAFKADAWHHRSDALSSVGSLIGIFLSRMGYPIFDPIVSIFISIFIIKVGYDIFKGAIDQMVDQSCDESYEQKLKDFILNHTGIESIDLLKTRMFGEKVYIDLEIGIDGNKSLEEAHTIAEDVHNKVEENFPEVKHIMIHMNPACI